MTKKKETEKVRFILVKGADLDPKKALNLFRLGYKTSPDDAVQVMMRYYKPFHEEAAHYILKGGAYNVEDNGDITFECDVEFPKDSATIGDPGDTVSAKSA